MYNKFTEKNQSQALKRRNIFYILVNVGLVITGIAAHEASGMGLPRT